MKGVELVKTKKRNQVNLASHTAPGSQQSLLDWQGVVLSDDAVLDDEIQLLVRI